jgi:opacity protein-like surface antigen
MRRSLCLLAFSLLFGFSAAAQDKADAFLGYSYVHQNYGNGVDSFNLNGGVFQVAAYPTKWFGLVGEFGLYTPGTVTVNTLLPEPTSTNFQPMGADFSYLFGPRLTFRHGPLQPYVEGLIGGFHISQGLESALGATSANSFAMAIGGGLDLRVSHHFAIRLGQVDYFLTRLPNPAAVTFTQNNFRYSGGIVFRY